MNQNDTPRDVRGSIGSGLIAIVAATVLLACSDPSPSDLLNGQWKLSMSTSSGVSDGISRGEKMAAGIVVFRSGIPEHGGLGPSPDLNPPYAVGRGYIDLRPIIAGDGSGGDSYEMLDDLSADLFEEIVATEDSGRVQMVLAPRVIGGNVRFEGILQGTVIKGHWTIRAHGAGPAIVGSFVMEKTHRTEYYDSALVRARRWAKQ